MSADHMQRVSRIKQSMQIQHARLRAIHNQIEGLSHMNYYDRNWLHQQIAYWFYQWYLKQKRALHDAVYSDDSIPGIKKGEVFHTHTRITQYEMVLPRR